MEAFIIGSCSYLKLVSCKHNNIKGFLKSPLIHHTHDVLLSISSVSSSSETAAGRSRSRVCPVSCSSSHTQAAEFNNHELLVQESLNGHTNEAETETETVRVKFQLHRECSFGQNFLITGDDQVLGLWDPNNAIPLTWSQGHFWTADIDIPIGKCIKFKFIMQESEGVFVWQPGPDRVLECFKTDKMMTLCEDWEDPDSRKIIEIDPTLNHMVEASGETLVQPLVSVNTGPDEGVPVLIPGLSQYREDSVNVASDDEPEPHNGSAMASTESDTAEDLILPELDLKGDAETSDLNPRFENQDSSENEHQQVGEEQVTQPMEPNDVEWGHNIVQKLFSIFNIQ